MIRPGIRRILYLIDSLDVGGAEHGLALTLENLDRERFDPEVAFLWGPDSLAPRIRALGVPVRPMGARKGFRALLAVPRIARILRRERFDAVHTQVQWSSIDGRLAGRLARVKVISHVVNAYTRAYPRSGLGPWAARKAGAIAWLDEATGRFLVDRFVAISEAVRDRPIRGASWDRSKFTVVHRGHDADTLLSEAAREPDPPLDDVGSPTLLCVGRNSPQKGHRYLIEAMPRVLAGHPRARLLLAGDGSLRGELEERSAPLGDAVAFLGVRDDVPALLAHADVFVFPSLWEGVGHALREAMIVGRPVVATDIPAHREYVTDGETGVLVPAANPDALADGILRVLADPDDARAMGKRAAESVSRFDIRRTTRDLEGVYDEVFGR